MRRVAAISLIILLLIGTGMAVESDIYVNSTEPGFLRGIGPEDPRIDNPFAAAIVAGAVVLIILRGLRRYDRSVDRKE